jgi:transcriptional regulator with XRE-family HTH domain
MDIQARRRQRLAKLIKSKREDMGLSQRAMALKLGFRQATIHQWESGRTEPDVSSLEKIADFLGYAMDELWIYLDGNDKNSTSQNWDLDKILNAIDKMPSNQVALIVSAGAQKLAQAS